MTTRWTLHPHLPFKTKNEIIRDLISENMKLRADCEEKIHAARILAERATEYAERRRRLNVAYAEFLLMLTDGILPHDENTNYSWFFVVWYAKRARGGSDAQKDS
jgi:hypothetical protein